MRRKNGRKWDVLSAIFSKFFKEWRKAAVTFGIDRKLSFRGLSASIMNAAKRPSFGT